MLRKCSSLMCTICVILMMGGQARAAEQVGSVRVIPQWCSESIAGGRVSVCRVGMKTADGIQVTDGLANWGMEEEHFQADHWIDWLLQSTEGKSQSAEIQKDSGAVFSGLEAGIYLVQQEEATPDYKAFAPFLQNIPENGIWNVTVQPNLTYAGESPKTGDRPAPIIGAMGIGLSAAILMVLADSRKK